MESGIFFSGLLQQFSLKVFHTHLFSGSRVIDTQPDHRWVDDAVTSSEKIDSTSASVIKSKDFAFLKPGTVDDQLKLITHLKIRVFGLVLQHVPILEPANMEPVLVLCRLIPSLIICPTKTSLFYCLTGLCLMLEQVSLWTARYQSG